VVVTSSVAAVHGDAADVRAVPGGIFNESHWNTSSTAKYNPYQYSKTVAEREAWKIAEKQSQYTLVTINPGFVMGPSLSKRVDSTSVDTMRSLMNGKYKTGVPDLYFGVVDVRDVARAHILAAINDRASGRNICVAGVVPILEMAVILRNQYLQKPIPKSKVPSALLYLVGPLMDFSWKFLKLNLGIPFKIDNKRSRDILGLQYRSIEETLTDHAEQLIRDGLV
jgi:nucleoside-diphosphate-sugar epimerase